MKMLKTTILSLLIVMSLGAAKANTIVNGNDDRLSINYAVNSYVDAVSRGNAKEMTALLDDNVKYSIERAGKAMVFNKAQYVEQLNDDKNIEQDCLVTSTVDETTPDVTIVKVDLKYAEFTRTNYVTLVNSGKGWKITNIYSTFK